MENPDSYNPSQLDNIRIGSMAEDIVHIVEEVDDGWLSKALISGYYDWLVFGVQLFWLSFGILIVVVGFFMAINYTAEKVQFVRGTPAVDAREDVLNRH